MNAKKLEEAKEVFGETMIKIATEGRRYLGGSVGRTNLKTFLSKSEYWS